MILKAIQVRFDMLIVGLTNLLSVVLFY